MWTVNPMSELRAMRTRGEIGPEQYRRARRILWQDLSDNNTFPGPAYFSIMDKIDAAARWIMKWFAIVLALLVVAVFVAGLSGFLDMTPEEMAALESRREEAAKTEARLKAISDAKQKKIAQTKKSLNDPYKILKYGYGEIIDRDEYGSKWPYPASDYGILRCKIYDFGFGTTPRPSVTIEIDDIIYGVNGVAIGKIGMPNSEQLMARGEYGEFVIGAIGDIIKRAIRDCQ